jgi:cytochrome P450
MNALFDRAPIPDHVPRELVHDFNIYEGPRDGRSLHDWIGGLHDRAPDIFFSPALGGHWVVTRFDDASAVLMDAENFSSRQRLPKAENPYQMIPLNTDPPEHRPYRHILTRFFSSKTVADLQPKIRAWAERLIDGVAPRGRCDFTDELAGIFPVSIFMEMMGLPLERLREFRGTVVEYFGPLTPHRRVELEAQIHRFMAELIEDRRKAPRADLASELLAADVNGRALTPDELRSMTFLLFVAGMDTVANALMFAFRHLASDPSLQAFLASNPDRIPDFVEESMRRYSIVNIQRMATRDLEFRGVQLRKGDMILCPCAAAGLDDRKNPDPQEFDLDRKRRSHINFSTGVHTCAGQFLGRAEMRIFVEEWLRRVPSFSIPERGRGRERAALVMALENLELEWPVAG